MKYPALPYLVEQLDRSLLLRAFLALSQTVSVVYFLCIRLADMIPRKIAPMTMMKPPL